MSSYSKGQEKPISLPGSFVCPGYIDIHNHGAMNFDIMDASFEALDAITNFHFTHGVSAFLASTMTAPQKAIENVLLVLQNYKPKVPVGLLGIHLEGPYLSPENVGGHEKKYLQEPDSGALEFVSRYRELIKMITVAPNLPGATGFIAECVKMGIIVFGGHDNSIEPEVHKAIDSGMRGVTHITCCSSSISRKDYHKYAGITEIALGDPRLFVEVIADGWHITKDIFNLIYSSKGYSKICLVSDSIRATGLEPGAYYLGSKETGITIEVIPGIAILKDHSAFAGSVTPVCFMVERLVREYGIPIEEAVSMASSVPA
jgi:N-acetylglucosamine-6-phosphate deacetylase